MNVCRRPACPSELLRSIIKVMNSQGGRKQEAQRQTYFLVRSFSRPADRTIVDVRSESPLCLYQRDPPILITAKPNVLLPRDDNNCLAANHSSWPQPSPTSEHSKRQTKIPNAKNSMVALNWKFSSKTGFSSPTTEQRMLISLVMFNFGRSRIRACEICDQELDGLLAEDGSRPDTNFPGLISSQKHFDIDISVRRALCGAPMDTGSVVSHGEILIYDCCHHDHRSSRGRWGQR